MVTHRELSHKGIADCLHMVKESRKNKYYIMCCIYYEKLRPAFIHLYTQIAENNK